MAWQFFFWGIPLANDAVTIEGTHLRIGKFSKNSRTYDDISQNLRTSRVIGKCERSALQSGKVRPSRDAFNQPVVDQARNGMWRFQVKDMAG
jgi:hypothetical protein